MFIIMQLVWPMCFPDSVGSTHPVADQSRRSSGAYPNSSRDFITARSLCMEGVAAVIRFTSHKRLR